MMLYDKLQPRTFNKRGSHQFSTGKWPNNSEQGVSRKPLPDPASRKPLTPVLKNLCQKSKSAEYFVQTDF